MKLLDKYNKLKILKIIDSKKIKCECECGNIITAYKYQVITWEKKSCWCHRYKPKHELFWSRIYNIWYWMKSRCNDKNNKNYWGRWIYFEKRWDSFQNFLDDMWDSYKSHEDKYWEQNTTLDREKVNENYSKSNCRWATLKEQLNNQRRTEKFKWKSFTEWIETFWLIFNVEYWYKRRHSLTLEQFVKEKQKSM